MANQRFSIDTKGICFLCLCIKDNKRVNADVTVTTTIHSFQKLSRYLDLDFQRIFNISFPNQTLEDTELLVSLCNKCSVEANTFSQLYEEMEAIMLKANVCVKNMHRLMKDANRNPILLQQYKDRMITTNPLELVQANIAENFRKELMDKCSQKIKKEGLLKNNKRMPNLVQLPTNFCTSLVLLPLPSGSSAGQETQDSPNFKNQVSNVECVVRGDSDEEKGDSPPDSELVITSVSGANGVLYEELASKNSKSASTSSTSTQPVSQSNLLQEDDSFFESLFSLSQFSSNTPKSTNVSSDNWLHIGDGRALCKVCSKILTIGPRILRNHERIHSGHMPFQCIYCPERFRNNSTLRSHFISDHRAELLSKFRSNAVQLEEFKKLVDQVVQKGCIKKLDESRKPHYMCSYCSKHVRQKPDMEAHLIQYHLDNVGQKLTQIQNDPTLFNKIKKTNIPDFAQIPSSTSINNVNFNSNPFGESLKSSALPLPASLPTTLHPNSSSSGVTISPINNIAKRPKLNQESPAPKSTLAHRRSQENTDKKYSCPHCESSFKFYSTHRIHLLTVHRFKILKIYLEKGTTLEEVNDVFNPLLKEWLPNGTHCKCIYCDRLFTPKEVDLYQLRNHMLLTHFNELVARLTKGLKEKKLQEDRKLLVPKFEEGMVSILPN